MGLRLGQPTWAGVGKVVCMLPRWRRGDAAASIDRLTGTTVTRLWSRRGWFRVCSAAQMSARPARMRAGRSLRRSPNMARSG